MRKCIKWILLFMFIISFIILIVLFFNYDDSKLKKDISIIYNKHWYRDGVSLYDNGKFISENFKLGDTRYLYFTKDFVKYCDNATGACEQFNYIYDEENGTIYLDSSDYFIVKGTYNIEYDENEMKLIEVTDGVEFTHYFDIPK